MNDIINTLSGIVKTMKEEFDPDMDSLIDDIINELEGVIKKLQND